MHKQNFSIDMIYIIKCLDMWYMYMVSLVTIYKRHTIFMRKKTTFVKGHFERNLYLKYLKFNRKWQS